MGKRKSMKRKNKRKRWTKAKYLNIKRSSITNLTLKTPLKIFKKEVIMNDLIESFKSNHI